MQKKKKSDNIQHSFKIYTLNKLESEGNFSNLNKHNTKDETLELFKVKKKTMIPLSTLLFSNVEKIQAQGLLS